LGALGPARVRSSRTWIYVATIYGNKMIGIRYSTSYGKMEAARKVASAISGVEGALPNHFKSSPEEICEILNRWRQRFG